MTAQMAMQATHPQLSTALFAGSNQVRLPADVSVRLNSGQLQPGDAAALRATYLEKEAQYCERLQQIQADQRIADQTLASRQNFEESKARNAAFCDQSLVARMLNNPLTTDQIAAKRKRYGGAVQE